MSYRYSIITIGVLCAINTIFAQDSIQSIHNDFQRENSFEISAIDESTQDENADLAGQNFSTLATFSNDPFLSEVGFQDRKSVV